MCSTRDYGEVGERNLGSNPSCTRRSFPLGEGWAEGIDNGRKIALTHTLSHREREIRERVGVRMFLIDEEAKLYGCGESSPS
jgi:hypothetical protein